MCVAFRDGLKKTYVYQSPMVCVAGFPWIIYAVMFCAALAGVFLAVILQAGGLFSNRSVPLDKIDWSAVIFVGIRMGVYQAMSAFLVVSTYRVWLSEEKGYVIYKVGERIGHLSSADVLSVTV